MPIRNISANEIKTATFAGGCFWCTEADFEKLDGVIEVISGYSGGSKKNPTYKDVVKGKTGHLESVQVKYNPLSISYSELLNSFWCQINPTDAGGQFIDRGTQYTTAIFYHNNKQKELAINSKNEISESNIYKNAVVTKIIRFQKFYKAENYHQDYYKKNYPQYKRYREHSGRNQHQEKIRKTCGIRGYAKPPNEKLKKILTPLQYKITQENGTEPAFTNKYHLNKKNGIYVDIVSGEVLFSSKDKFYSKSGWPSFTKPLELNNIIEKEDLSFLMVRTEVRSKKADSHLGHLFSDGPKPSGKRYCINSAALRFVPEIKLEIEGYKKYKNLFKN